MKKIFFTPLVFFSLFWILPLSAQTLFRSEPVRFLALGDSYTIGQSVTVEESWPIQLGRALQEEGLMMEEIKIIAQTGWRTDQLQNSILTEDPETRYNLVSLLIGVNNQYQGGNIETYEAEFEELLKTAIRLAGNNENRVMVLSIPDYAYTPFGNGSASISLAINQFNTVNRRITNQYQVAYHDITPISRQGLDDPSLVASDGLHPSGKMYALWVRQIMLSLDILETTSLHNLTETREIQVFHDHIRVTTAREKSILTIYNIGGQKVFQQNNLAPGPPHRIAIPSLNRGLYLVALEQEGTTVKLAKLVVY